MSMNFDNGLNLNIGIRRLWFYVKEENGTEVEHIPFMTSNFCDQRGMQIVFLGTSSSMPTLRCNTFYILQRLGQNVISRI